ncbi:MAG: protoporphyrinogen oxidase [Actinomycetota bacterium]
MTDRVVVVGGGVAGLATAYRLVGAPGPTPQVTVLEADRRPGGKVGSVQVGGLTLESGPDSFVARKPWATELFRELGIAGELEAPGASRAYVWTDRGLAPLPATALGVPASVGELARWPGLSLRGRRRALADLVRKPRRDDADESIGGLVRRRLGDEVAEKLVGPILGGLFAGDPDRLSVRAAFPELQVWEQKQGSLIRGARAALRAGPSGGPGPMFLRPRSGMERLTDALVEAIGPARILSDSRATGVRRDGPGFVVEAGDTEHSGGCVVLATPAFASAELLARLAPAAAGALGAIQYTSTAVVLLVYPDGTGAALPDATGFVVPRGKASMTACTWVSRKWPSDELGARAVLRCFVGGVGAEDVLDAPDEEIVEGVCRHLAAVLELPPAAESARVVRWERAMPQYEVGHLDRVAAIEDALPEGIFVVGAAYRGVGIADCVWGAGEIATRVRAHLAGEPVPSVEQESVR